MLLTYGVGRIASTCAEVKKWALAGKWKAEVLGLKGRVAGLERQAMVLVREKEGLQGQVMKLKAQVGTEQQLVY